MNLTFSDGSAFLFTSLSFCIFCTSISLFCFPALYMSYEFRLGRLYGQATSTASKAENISEPAKKENSFFQPPYLQRTHVEPKCCLLWLQSSSVSIEWQPSHHTLKMSSVFVNTSSLTETCSQQEPRTSEAVFFPHECSSRAPQRMGLLISCATAIFQRRLTLYHNGLRLIPFCSGECALLHHRVVQHFVQSCS